VTGARTAKAGLYGKIPGLGDFLHRGLPSSFVEPWNAWVSAGFLKSRELLGEAWMQAYLTSPPWRFLVEPGVLGADGWVGTMASSVDTVGRCYPIAAALPLPEDTRLQWLGAELESLTDRLERIALDLIDGAVTPEAAMTRIDGLALAAMHGSAPVPLLGRGGRERLMLGKAPAPLAGLALRWLGEAGPHGEDDRLSAWWHGGWDETPAAHLVTAGLPAPETFASLLDGAWTNRHWTEQLGDGGPA
jgi:type VI secretion system protein ImpM